MRARKAFLKIFLEGAFLLGFLLLSGGMSFAEEFPDAGQKCSLTISFQKDKAGFAGTCFSLYRAGEWTGGEKLDLTEKFVNCREALDSLDRKGWQGLASVLGVYAEKSDVVPDFTGLTDGNGLAEFTGIPAGIYLVTGQPVKRKNVIYRPVPVLLSLPAADAEGQWVYEQHAAVKYMMESRPGGEGNGGNDGSGGNEDSGSGEKSFGPAIPAGSAADEAIQSQYVLVGESTGSGLNPMENNGEKLPQTGILWWPVPILIAAGMFCMIVGALGRKGRKNPNFAGMLLFAAALFLSTGNLRDEVRAADNVASVRKKICALEVQEERTGAEHSGEVPISEIPVGSIPAQEMLTMEIDGQNYMGILEIPSRKLSLPILDSWSYPSLQLAPCRYSGTVGEENLVIAGHNYRAHFSGLKYLKPGDAVTFTDMEGNQYDYEVLETEILESTDVEGMTESKDRWKLTLFTCTYGGRQRIAVRCGEMIQK